VVEATNDDVIETSHRPKFLHHWYNWVDLFLRNPQLI